MASQVSLQASITDIPQTAINLLGGLAPILRALSADNVNPLAVIQLEAIGSRFPISGPLARQIPDALARSGWKKLGRLQSMVGWMPNDTATALAQTAGGQASALLTLGLVEMFCRNSTGHLLFELSMKVLPKDQCLASMGQLSDLAEIVSNKLEPLAFGQHHAIQVTRIREAYLNSGITVPHFLSASLLDRVTVDFMVDLLDAVQQAVRDDSVMVHIEGFKGLGGIVSLLMALCPDDVLLVVENAIIFQGQRRSVTISINHTKNTLVHVEKIVRGRGSFTTFPAFFRPNDFLLEPGRLSSYDHLTMQAEGCLASMVQQLLGATLKESNLVIASFVDLIGAIMCSFTGLDFGSTSDFPREGLRSLLGPRAHECIQDKLKFLFGIAPPLDNNDLVVVYERFCQSISNLVPDSTCACSHHSGLFTWAYLASKGDPCPLCSIWGGFQSLVGIAVLLCLVNSDLPTVRIVQSPRMKLGPYLCRRLLHRVYPHLHCQSHMENRSDISDRYTIRDIHTDLCQLLGCIPTNAGDGHNVLGTSSGATSIVPLTLVLGSSNEAHIVRYQVFDGQFHDGRNYYQAITEPSHIQPRPSATDSILRSQNTIGPSSIGAHSGFTLSLRPHHNSLALRATVKFRDQITEISFYDVNLAYMATSVAHPCAHHPSDSVTLPDTISVIATGIEAPVASDSRTSAVLTHGNSEAQLLAGILGVPSLFQGRSCLSCMIEDAKKDGFRLLVQGG